MGVVIYHVFLVLPLAGIDSPHAQRIDVFDGPLLAQHVFLGFFNGRGLVTLFFVLSGCVLALSLRRRPKFGPAQVPGYLIRRAARLYPLLVIAAIFGAVLQYAIPAEDLDKASEWANWHYNVPREDLPWELGLNAIGYSNSLNSPAWSIKVELLGSLIFPVLFALTLRPWLAGFSALVLAAIMFVSPGEPRDYALMNVFAFSFFLGALIPRYGNKFVRLWQNLGKGARTALLAGVIVIFMFARRSIDPVSFVSAPVVLIESLCSALFVTLAMFVRAPTLLKSSVLQACGRISYGIYLFHLIVLFALVHAILPYIPAEDSRKVIVLATFFCLATVTVTVPLSWALYEWLEAPLQRLGNRLGRHSDTWLAVRMNGLRAWKSRQRSKSRGV